MKNIYVYLKLMLLVTSIIFSLKIKAQSQVEKCGSDAIHRENLLNNPQYAQKMATYENYVKNLKSSVRRTTSIVYQIPTVVHVMHKGEAVGSGTNVSDAAIQNAIKVLNQMYRKAAGTPWNGGGVDVEIEYVLAVRDPSGNCTNGIVRYNMSSNSAYMTYGIQRSGANGITDGALKALSVWNQSNYYNIWLVSEIDDNEGGAGIQGYAYFASSHGTSIDGSVILSSNFTSGTSTTAAHEIGHSLNLYHTFEDDLNGTACPSAPGDLCADTPPHIRSGSDCVTGSNACDGGSPRDLFIHNYMDYSSDLCQNMLTADQKTRMIAALTTDRSSFLASNGNMGLVPVSTAGVNFEASASVLCGTGQSISFTDKSSCIPNSYIPSSAFAGVTHSWVVTNGTNTYTSSLQNPVITFNHTGKFNVTLTITNANGTTTLTKPEMIIVSAAPAAACIPASTASGNYGQTISNVVFNTINNSTSSNINTPYTDLVCSYNTVVNAGNTYLLSLLANAGGSGAENFEVYIDYNANNSFADAGELVFSGATPATNISNTFTTNITIPLTANLNTLLRMRVIGDADVISATAKTCGSSLFIGDVKDYGVYINAACSTPTVSVTPTSTTICSGESVVLTASGATTYTWLPSGSGTTNTVSPTSTTVYTITGNTSGCVSSPVTVTVTVNAAPILTVVSTQTSTCSGYDDPIVLTASGAATYTWLPSGSGSTNTIVPTVTSVYTVTGNDGTCNSLPTTYTLTVLPTPTITTAPVSPTVCSGSSLTLTATGATSYTWIPTANGSGASLTNTVSVTPFSTTDYRVIGMDNGCISDTTFAEVNVLETLNLTASSTSTLLCNGATTTLTASGATTYTWLPSGTGASINVTPSSTTVYTVTGEDNGCVSAPKTLTITVGTSPSITITPVSPTICVGQNVTLSASGASTYTWTPFLVGANSVVSPTTTTTYSVVGNSGSCTSLPTVVTVTVKTVPVLAVTPTSATICTGGSTVLNVSGANTYTWSPVGSGPTNTVNPTFTTVYSVIGTVDGCNSVPVASTVVVLPVPSISTSPSNTMVCSGSTVTLNVSGTTSYTWLPSGTGATNTVVVGPLATTVYTVIGSNGGCNSTPKTVTVAVNAVPSIALNTTNVSICTGNSTILSASGAVSYIWLPTGAGTTNIVNPTTTTVYTVTGNSNGCNSLPQTVTVNVTPTPTVVVTPTGTTICSGQSATLTASGATSYNWQPFGSGNSVVVTPVNSTTTYTVVGTTNGCSGNPKTVSVYMLTTPFVSVLASPATICLGSQSTLQASGASIYTWTPGNLSGANPVVSPTITTIYSVVGSFGGACTSSSTVEVTVNPCTGVEDLTSSNEIIVFPNPNNGVFTIASGATVNDMSVTVFNGIGQVVKTDGVKNSDKLVVDMTALAKGIYYVKVQTSDSNKLFKIIIE